MTHIKGSEISSVWCERCKKPLMPEKALWLELDMDTGLYHTSIPKGHKSQGMFPFGADCEAIELQKTMKILTVTGL